ncbi:MAG: hypothetical protein ACK5ME_13190 [Parahaliea sp.]
MKTNFKPLGLVAAVAAATAGYSGVTTAAASGAMNSLGDLVLVPYYTVREGFGTGIHLINTSDRTQVVKVRFRRGADSMDALDFNIVMSPKDAWTGFLNNEGDDIYLASQDKSCTAPAMTNGRFKMPSIYRVGAEEGYIEMIAMGTPVDEEQPIAIAALHDADGVPADCTAVRSNFFSGGTATKKGVISSEQTNGFIAGTQTLALTDYEDSGNVLKISYFVRDADAGLEFGNDGVHVADFLDAPSITNQERGINSGDLQGFDFPDLDGGAPTVTADRGKYEELRSVLGGVSVINDWSANGDLNVGTDWVVTVPGQYTMIDLLAYYAALEDVDSASYTTTDAWPDDGDDVTDHCGTTPAARACDNRDIPLTATFDVYDREEQTLATPDGELVVSPQLPGETVRTVLPAEVNVVTWGTQPVLDSAEAITVTVPDGAIYGWAELKVEATSTKDQAVCNPATTNAEAADIPASFVANGGDTPLACTPLVNTGVPMIGFVAWERSFDANPDANYGRVVEHSYGSAS